MVIYFEIIQSIFGLCKMQIHQLVKSLLLLVDWLMS